MAIAIQVKREEYLTQGWQNVEVMPRGSRFYEWEHQKTTKKKGGSVWIAVLERGEVEIHEGYVSRDEARKREKQERGETDNPKPAKPELTSPMQNYVELHRLAAIRLELLNHPQVALRLTLAHMIVGSSLWMVKPEAMKPAKPEIGLSVAANPASAYFEERRKELLTLLGFEEDRGSLVRPNGDDYSLASIFAQLLKLTEDDVLRLMALAMAETLAVGTASAELAGSITGATLNDWRPDDTFFDLLNRKDVVNSILTDIGSAAIADGNKAETAKVQKGIIKDIMRGENGREQNADWLPAYFRFPPEAYTSRGGVSAVDKWQSVSGLRNPAS